MSEPTSETRSRYYRVPGHSEEDRAWHAIRRDSIRKALKEISSRIARNPRSSALLTAAGLGLLNMYAGGAQAFKPSDADLPNHVFTPILIQGTGAFEHPIPLPDLPKVTATFTATPTATATETPFVEPTRNPEHDINQQMIISLNNSRDPYAVRKPVKDYKDVTITKGIDTGFNTGRVYATIGDKKIFVAYRFTTPDGDFFEADVVELAKYGITSDTLPDHECDCPREVNVKVMEDELIRYAPQEGSTSAPLESKESAGNLLLATGVSKFANPQDMMSSTLKLAPTLKLDAQEAFEQDQEHTIRGVQVASYPVDGSEYYFLHHLGILVNIPDGPATVHMKLTGINSHYASVGIEHTQRGHWGGTGVFVARGTDGMDYVSSSKSFFHAESVIDGFYQQSNLDEHPDRMDVRISLSEDRKSFIFTYVDRNGLDQSFKLRIREALKPMHNNYHLIVGLNELSGQTLRGSIDYTIPASALRLAQALGLTGDADSEEEMKKQDSLTDYSSENRFPDGTIIPMAGGLLPYTQTEDSLAGDADLVSKLGVTGVFREMGVSDGTAIEMGKYFDMTYFRPSGRSPLRDGPIRKLIQDTGPNGTKLRFYDVVDLTIDPSDTEPIPPTADKQALLAYWADRFGEYTRGFVAVPVLFAPSGDLMPAFTKISSDPGKLAGELSRATGSPEKMQIAPLIKNVTLGLQQIDKMCAILKAMNLSGSVDVEEVFISDVVPSGMKKATFDLAKQTFQDKLAEIGIALSVAGSGCSEIPVREAYAIQVNAAKKGHVVLCNPINKALIRPSAQPALDGKEGRIFSTPVLKELQKEFAAAQ